MQKFILLILFVISTAACSQKKEIYTDHTAQIKGFQYKINSEFSDKEHTPLTTDDFITFKSLDFFPIDSVYNIKAKFELENTPKTFAMPTTTDRLAMYKNYGKATFTLEGKKLILHIYQNQELIKKDEYKNHLFIPFTDKTNGNETYGGGRFIDLEIPEGDTIIIDFNKAYNPYCAYNIKYSCPIPPKENYLDAAIKSGVKAYKK